RREIDRIAGDTAPEPGRAAPGREQPQSGTDLAEAIGADQGFLTFQAEFAAKQARREDFRKAKPDAEPAQPVSDAVGGFPDPVACLHHSLPRLPQGVSTTFTQPSCLSRKVLYISGPSSSFTLWVITKDGSIWPSSMRRRRSSVQRFTWVWPVRMVRPFCITMPKGILSIRPP